MVGGVLLEFLIIPLNFIVNIHLIKGGTIYIKVKFTFSCDDESVNKTNLELCQLKQFLKDYKMKEQWVGDDIYEINQNTELYQKVTNFVKNNLDGTAELVMLPRLVEKLKEAGVDQKYFQPIISKRKKILGYIFVTDNILPVKSYIDENSKFENQCPSCQRINMTENKEELYYKQKQLSNEGIKALKDVNKTYEFYDRYREIIVSKKVAQVIRENVPDVEFYPVFKELEK